MMNIHCSADVIFALVPPFGLPSSLAKSVRFEPKLDQRWKNLIPLSVHVILRDLQDTAEIFLNVL